MNFGCLVVGLLSCEACESLNPKEAAQMLPYTRQHNGCITGRQVSIGGGRYVPGLFVVTSVTAVGRQPDRVIEAQQARYLVYQINGVSFELVVARQFFRRILPHAVRMTLRRREEFWSFRKKHTAWIYTEWIQISSVPTRMVVTMRVLFFRFCTISICCSP